MLFQSKNSNHSRSKREKYSIKNSFFKKIQFNWQIISIILLALFLRFWKLEELLIFTFDEQLEAFIVKNIVTFYHLPAIGVSVAPVGLHLSPFFYYLAAIPFVLGNLHPISWGVTAAFIGTFTTGFLYYSTLKMFSKRIAIIASLLYASSFLMVMYDKHFWNVSPIPLVSIVVVYSLFQLIHESTTLSQGVVSFQQSYKKYIWAIPLFLSLGLGLSSHLSSFVLLVLTIIVFMRDKIPFFKKEVLIGFGLFLLTQLPLAIFELRHNFSQTQALLKFLSFESGGGFDISRIVNNFLIFPKVFSRLIYTFGPHDVAYEHTYGLQPILERDSRIPFWMFILSIGIFLIYIWKTIKNWKSHALKLHLVLIMLSLTGLLVYGLLFKGSLFEFYLAVSFPSLFIVSAVVVDELMRRKFLVIMWLLIFFLTVINLFASLTAINSFGLSKKIELINWVKDKIGDREYSLHSIGIDKKYEGYRYLFERFYKAPVKSYVDPQMEWTYQHPVSKDHPGLMVVIYPDEKYFEDNINKEREKYESGKIDEIHLGKIHGMIVDTTKLRFDLDNSRDD